MDGYVTVLAGILRSVRFGAGDSHARRTWWPFHFFEKMARSPVTRHRRYRVNSKNEDAMNALSAPHHYPGDGDYACGQADDRHHGLISPNCS